MQVRFTDNTGSALNQSSDVIEGTTVNQLFGLKMHGRNRADYMIMVNGDTIQGCDPVLNQNDVVTIAPKKYAGAAAHSFGIARIAA